MAVDGKLRFIVILITMPFASLGMLVIGNYRPYDFVSSIGAASVVAFPVFLWAILVLYLMDKK